MSELNQERRNKVIILGLIYTRTFGYWKDEEKDEVSARSERKKSEMDLQKIDFVALRKN